MQVHVVASTQARSGREATASAGSTTIARKQTTAGEKSKKAIADHLTDANNNDRVFYL
jgi:hypothetical protein